MTRVSGQAARRGAAFALCAGMTTALVATALVAPAQGAEQVLPVVERAEPAGSGQLAAGVIYKLKPGYAASAAAASSVSASVARAAGRDVRTTDVPVGELTSAVDFVDLVDAATAERAAAAVAANPAVAWAEPNYVATTAGAGPVTPKDPYFAQYQWNVWDSRNGSTSGVTIPNGGWSSHALSLWPRTKGSGVVVAVIDTGRTRHSDLDGHTVNGYDMISSATSARDGNGRDSDATDKGDLGSDGVHSSWHGTHVAGIVGAMTNTSWGAGVAPNSRIQHVRVLGSKGGTFADIAAGVTWASGGSVSGVPKNSKPARVLNLSIQTKDDMRCPSALQDAIKGARARGAVVIAAAGNYNKSASLSVPGNCQGVITVAALDRNGKRASYSNRGSAVDIAAPGGGGGSTNSGYVWSTINTGTKAPGAAAYGGMAGTSQAAPAVAGGAALLASLGLKGAALESALLRARSSFPRYAGSPANCSTTQCGRGYLDLSKVLVAIKRAKITGTPAVGQTLKVGTAKGFTGKVTGKKFQWFRNGSPISGATGQSYKLTSADRGKQISARITPRSDGSYYAQPSTSLRTAKVS